MEGYDSDETVVEMVGGCSDSPILFGPGSERFMHQSQSQQPLSLASLLPAARVTVSDQNSSEQPQKKLKQQGVAAKPKSSINSNSNSNSKPRKKPASGAASSATQALQRQQEVVTLLKKLPSAGEGDASFSVWALLKAYDLVELSTLASYVDGSVSDLSSLTKKDLAETLSRALQCGKLERELQKTQVQQLPLVVSQSHTEVADAGTGSGAAASAASAASAPSAAAFIVTASGWQPISASQPHILTLLQASDPSSSSSGIASGLIEVGGGVQLSVEGWGRADTTTELLLNFDDPCFSALRLARQLKPQGRGGVKSGQQQQQGHASNSAAIVSALQAGLSAFASNHSNTADARPASPPPPPPTLRNASAQTETLPPAPGKYQQPSSSSSQEAGHGRAAVKCCRFDAARLGLGFKSLKSLGGHNTRTVITSVARELVDPSVSKLLTVGDELVQINGTTVFGLSFAEQMDCLRTSPRPLFLSFASSA